MNITITGKEYDAIHFAIGQVEVDLEAATNDDYIRGATDCLEALNSIVKKYHKARYNANLFRDARAEISRRNRNLRSRDIDKLARKLVRKIKENEKDII